MDAEIFLTTEEAKDAVCLDLEQYGLQEDTLEEMAAMAGGGWPERFREVMSGGEGSLYEMIALVQEFLNSPTLTEEALCRAFSLMFWSDVRKARGPEGEEGVALTTELHDFTCLQCGQCCTNLDYSRALTAEDIAMWKKAGRDDLLAWVGKDKADGGYTIWIDPRTGEPQDPCPFLSMEGGKAKCAIHDVKPAICREYPATKKHGFMTGCIGIEQLIQKECAS